MWIKNIWNISNTVGAYIPKSNGDMAPANLHPEPPQRTSWNPTIESLWKPIGLESSPLCKDNSHVRYESHNI
jgi:hypothetical protein